jgi:hypothetical protein
MTGRRDDWLDGLAHRVVSPAAEPAPRTPDPAGSEERYARGKAVKLAIVGAASLSLGLWKAAPARAEDRAHCLAGCLDRYQEHMDVSFDRCLDAWAALHGASPNNPWPVVLNFYIGGLGPVLNGGAGLCVASAYARHAYRRGECIDHCNESCRLPGSRSVQGLFSSTCEVLPPPKDEPPVPPPPPTKGSECLNCESVGGICCGLQDPLCACATPGVPCPEYGC